MPGDPWTWFPVRRAPQCSIPTSPLAKNLMRLVPGDARGKRYPVSFRTSGPVREGPDPQSSQIALSINAVPSGRVVTVHLGRGGKERPDVWLDFMHECTRGFEFAVTVYAIDTQHNSAANDGVALHGAQLLGRSYLLPSDFSDLRGVVHRALVGPDHACVGELALEYLVVKPYCCSVTLAASGVTCSCSEGLALDSTLALAGMDMSANDKLKTSSPFFAGHRGLGGNSTSIVQENTVLSFALATRNANVRHVELDVQLTSDGTPIVYHDWFYRVPRVSHRQPNRIRLDSTEPCRIHDISNDHRLFPYNLTAEEFCSLSPVSSTPLTSNSSHKLSLDQADVLSQVSDSSSTSSSVHGYESDLEYRARRLRSARRSLSFCSRTNSTNFKDERSVLDSQSDSASHIQLTHRLPTLQDVCAQLPADIGLLIEIKYPPPNVQAALKIPFPERNYFIDRILQSLVCVDERKRIDRPLILMSFDADICTMLTLKQSRFPVFFQNCEQRDCPEECDDADPRTINCSNGIEFAKSQRCHGLVLFAEMVLEDVQIASKIVNDSDLVLMTYGCENRDPRLVLKQRDLGVNGVIADDIVKVSNAVAQQLKDRLPARNDDFASIASIASL